MSEIVERVTEAICQAERDWLESDRKISLQEATAWAAVRAMREPTEKMVDAGYDFTADPCWREDFIQAYQAMIDEALR